MTWRITSYMPSHRQFRLDEAITPELITSLVGEQDGPSKDGKCKFQWRFFAQEWAEDANGEMICVTVPCAIWDYNDVRWSAFGLPEVFQQLGLLPKEETVDDQI